MPECLIGKVLTERISCPVTVFIRKEILAVAQVELIEAMTSISGFKQYSDYMNMWIDRYIIRIFYGFRPVRNEGYNLEGQEPTSRKQRKNSYSVFSLARVCYLFMYTLSMFGLIGVQSRRTLRPISASFRVPFMNGQ